MLAALFSFEGRIGRLRYLGWSIVSMFVLAILGTALAFAVVMSLAGSMRGMTPDQILHRPALWAFAGIAVILFVWPSFALAAKRLRDIGLSPSVWLLIFVAFSAMDHLLIATLLHASMVKGTIVGGVFGWLSGVFLLLMPGKGDDTEKPDLTYLEPEFNRTRQQMKTDYDDSASLPPRPVIRKALPTAATPQAFGRRR